MSGLENTLFSWSLRDISDDTLFANKVEKIPETFECISKYLGSFVNPLLEETRAQLLSAMEAMHRAPFAEVVAAEASGEKEYRMRVDSWRNRSSDRSKEAYKTLPGDLMVVANTKIECLSDLGRTSWAFLSVKKVPQCEDDDEFRSLDFEVRASEFLDCTSRLTVVFLENLTTNVRIWKALHMSRNPEILDYVLSVTSTVREACDHCSDWDDEGLLTLNDSQRGAFRCCRHMLRCNNAKPGFELIWGPPGTGKTKTTATIILSLLKMKRRTVVCAPTNVAISELASRVVQMLASSGLNAPFCSLGDVLLFGNKERLKVGSYSREVYLEYRVETLAKCLGPLGLFHQFACMKSFLDDSVSQYNIFLENDLIGVGESENKNPKPFVEYVRKRFGSVVSPLRENISIFCTHIPESYISEQNFEKMVSLTMLLDCLESFFLQDNDVLKDLEELFSCSEATEDPIVDVSSFPSMKRACLSLLKCLHRSLTDLQLPRYMSTESISKFCFDRALLVFSTVSSSFKLHSMDIKPMTVLVIDEAAQLKECESTICLQLQGIKHVVLVGDECQLPATITSKVAEEACFGRSLFERLSFQNHPKHLLNTQYRMHPSISCFPNLKFYDNQIRDAPMVQRESYERKYLPGSMFGPYSFLNVPGGREEKDDDGHSRLNMVEAAVVLKILHNLHQAWLKSKENISIGVVSPYAAQVVEIQGKLGKKYEEDDGFRVKVKTVDGFQGGEEDIIIMSTVRSYGHSLEFISTPQRVNVALTRARHCLWILGSERTLTNSQSIWGPLLANAKSRGCFFNADDDKTLANAILETKKQLDQLDDLLNPDSLLFKNSKWVVRFSDFFLKSFKKLRYARIRKLVVNLLLKLASGWRPKRTVLASGGGDSLEILKYKVEGLYVICTVDIIKRSTYTQILKIWDVLPLESTPNLVKRLEAVFASYTDEFIALCNEKSVEANMEIPMSWPPSKEIIKIKDLTANETVGAVLDAGSCVENSKVSDSLLLMKFYKLSHPTVNHLLSDRDAGELDMPFEVTDQETEIILFPRSTFILGRSGTGKTTVLTHKLFQKERLHLEAKAELGENFNGENKVSVLRQLFVTVSPKLCNAVKKHVSDFKSFARCGMNTNESGSSEVECIDDEEARFTNIPDSLIDIVPDSYPLVVTFNKFLMMLDGTLSGSYFERFVDMSSAFHDQRRSSRSIALETFLRTKEVNYDKFNVSYWPHMNSKLTKNLDASSVFTEIISHIKGGQQALDSLDFKLTRDEYIMLSERRSSSLAREIRSDIYDLFQMYEKMKMENGEFDQADFVIDLHCRLKLEKYRGDQMDYVYIDEVQDLTMSQIALFKHICSNTEEGFVFSGDTAQTIACGIDFRFQDIKNLFYKRFLLESKGKMSKVWNLSQNFRTHVGILKLSQSVLELLYRFFPQSIDALEPENSYIYGDAPVWLQCASNENAMVKMFGNKPNDTQSSFVGFGAEQVILVRDEQARHEISSLVGKQALLLTILECKGLEFQDVLLYNFFGSSPLQSWRVIYEYMKEQSMFESESPNFPSFSESKHKLLCSELKQLYVAVTRTKQRLWICESSDVAEPVLEYWKQKCVVQEKQLDDSLAQAIQVASTPAEWRSQGIKLYHEKNYDSAMMCFEKAQDKYWERMSKASGLKAMADSKRTSKPDEAKSALREAAQLFEAIGKADLAANCFSDLGEYERAGRIYLDKFGDSELARAAECFSLAGCYELAAEVYAKGRFLSECLEVCSKGKLLDLGLKYITEWKRHSKSDGIKEIEKAEHEYLEKCAFHYHNAKDKPAMMNFVRAFKSVDSMRNFLRSLGYFDELIEVEIEAGNLLEAADIAKTRGDILKFAHLLGKARKFKDAASLILSYVLAKSLWCPGKGWPLKHFQDKEELLRNAESLAENEPGNFHELVCVESEIMLNNEGDLATFMTRMITSRKHQSLRGEFLCNRKLLDAHLSTKLNKYVWEQDMILDDLREQSQGMMFQNRVSVESLVHFWHSWRDKVANVFEYLECLRSQGVYEHLKNYEEFCLNFFGIWKQSHNMKDVYLLLGSDADWAREVSLRSSWNGGKLASIGVHQLASSAHAYWRSDTLSLGTKVLEKLNAVYSHQCQSNFSRFSQTQTLTYIYEVASHLSESKDLNKNSKPLHDHIRFAVDNFANYAIPLDCFPGSATLAMIRLRQADVFKKLLMRFIEKYTGTSSLSYQRSGYIAMLILGSGGVVIDDETYKKLMENLEWNPPWKALLGSVSGNRSLCRLLEALKDACNANMWRVKYFISPHCFLYLVENLLNRTASIQGYIVTSKSAFIEWLMYRDGDVPHLEEPPADYYHNYLFNAISGFLNEPRFMDEWTTKHSPKKRQDLPSLVTRMVVILCLLQANFGVYLNHIFRMLRRHDIARLLPVGFRDPILKEGARHFVSAVSKALVKVENNPLVIVRLDGKIRCPMSNCPNTIFIDMHANHSKDVVLRTLFPQTRERLSESLLKPACTTDSGKERVVEPTCSVPTDSGCVWDIFEAIYSGNEDWQSYAQTLEENLSKCISLSSLSSAKEEEGRQFVQLVDELKRLRSAMETSEQEGGSKVKELCKSLGSRRAVMEPLLNRLIGGGSDETQQQDCRVLATEDGVSNPEACPARDASGKKTKSTKKSGKRRKGK